jgi:SagB-type dehydrogenase family enzyme
MSSYRKHLKEFPEAVLETIVTDEERGLPYPDIQKPYPENADLIDLVPPDAFTIGHISLLDAINQRRSHRKYTTASLSLEEFSFLLWSTQGVSGFIRRGMKTLRTVPSGGAMHPFETYLAVNRVKGLAPGIYRYIAIGHKLYREDLDVSDLSQRVNRVSFDQNFVGKAAVVFIWSVRPYRTEWRYAETSLKDILMSAGHICQNLYLACEAIGAGTCAIAAYRQDELDALIGVDGEDEIAIYLAPVGKIQ